MERWHGCGMSGGDGQYGFAETDLRRYLGWVERLGLSGRVTLVVALAAVLAVATTYVIGAGVVPLQDRASPSTQPTRAARRIRSPWGVARSLRVSTRLWRRCG